MIKTYHPYALREIRHTERLEYPSSNELWKHDPVSRVEKKILPCCNRGRISKIQEDKFTLEPFPGSSSRTMFAASFLHPLTLWEVWIIGLADRNLKDKTKKWRHTVSLNSTPWSFPNLRDSASPPPPYKDHIFFSTKGCKRVKNWASLEH